MDKLLEESKELNASISTIEAQKKNMKDYLLKEPTAREEYMKSNMVLFEDDCGKPSWKFELQDEKHLERSLEEFLHEKEAQESSLEDENT
ncbi:hypothetical protein L484_011588 [Morus notabilis]|uniref:Uncharacterized protein n=1 Tax=Morus notabilis TaxID=981085 RepID=W9RZ84_9ROSA|nr:hypothetical protein L484_011588 [Morus notabilis]